MAPEEGEPLHAVLTRLRALEDERAVVELLHALTFAVDGADISAWLACFVDGGRFSWSSDEDAEPALDLSGHTELATWFREHRDSVPAGTQTHLLLHPKVDLDGDEATVRSTYATLRAIDDDVVVASSGEYTDHLERSDDGVWRVRHRRAVGKMSRSVAPAGR